MIDYDVKEGFVAEDGSNGRKDPREEDWVVRESQSYVNNVGIEQNTISYEILINSRSDYAIAVFENDVKVLARSYDKLIVKLQEMNVY